VVIVIQHFEELNNVYR